MNVKPTTNKGLERLVDHCRQEFQRKENLDFYEEEALQAARHKFIKFCLLNEIALDK